MGRIVCAAGAVSGDGVARDHWCMANPHLYISHAAELDWLTALEFGRVDDGQPAENWRAVADRVGFLHERPGGRVLGFKVLGFSELDVDRPALAEIWSGPRFDAPLLGLTDACAGEIIVAARAHFGDRPSVNRVYFQLATCASGEEALGIWLS